MWGLFDAYVELIKYYNSNNPSIGYNQWPNSRNDLLANFDIDDIVMCP